MLSEEGAPTALEFKLLRLIFLRTLELDGVAQPLSLRLNVTPKQRHYQEERAP